MEQLGYTQQRRFGVISERYTTFLYWLFYRTFIYLKSIIAAAQSRPA
jgi:hypothetical protein